MQIAGERILQRENISAIERAYADELISTARNVIDAWHSGKLRMFLATTKWIKVDGRATAWEATQLTGVILRWGPRHAAQYVDYLEPITFIQHNISSAVNRVLELRSGMQAQR